MLTQTLDRALEQCLNSVKRNATRFGVKRPVIGDGAGMRYKLNHGKPGHPHGDSWVESFWVGQLWLAYEQIQDAALLEAARAYQPYFEERFNTDSNNTHDVGFVYSLSAVADYRVTGSEAAKTLALRAADILLNRFNPQGRFIRAWDAWGDISNAGRMIIDTMDNLPLLYWASEVTGESNYAEVASAHAHTAARHLIRGKRLEFPLF